MLRTQATRKQVEEIQILLPCLDDPEPMLLLTLPVKRLAQEKFVVLEPVLFSRRYLRTHDVIEAKRLEDGSYRYEGTVRTTPMRGEAFWISRDRLRSRSCSTFLEQIRHHGGAWEFSINSILYLELPRGSDLWEGLEERVYELR